MYDFLNMEIWCGPRSATVTDVNLIEFRSDGGETYKKIQFTVENSYGARLIISDAWVTERDREPKVRGLYHNVDKHNGIYYIPSHTTVSKLLEYYSCKTISDMLGETVEVLPDENGYEVIIADSIQ
tara:strand:+ start:131 stop:508 length:378 start_codon:yes stop_codon:yes gene_type:complete